PYVAVIVMALMGINVNIVLTAGIVLTLALGAACGTPAAAMARAMGDGVEGMGGLIVVTLLAAGMLGLIKAYGGIDWLLRSLTARVHGRRGARLTLLVLVGAVNACTANNTVAIITVGDMARAISRRFGLSAARVASILDTGSCIVQCLIPYGAQTLLATGMAEINPVAPWPYLYYPWALLLCVVVYSVAHK
ncbi:MAG: Na+/H+ antiporter NhaC family protein, partial [Muribaculaceae bacterium]|nr:Na+/H+ antiporter NhaC family protein [Muribaculaceae bacterium]